MAGGTRQNLWTLTVRIYGLNNLKHTRHSEERAAATARHLLPSERLDFDIADSHHHPNRPASPT